MNYTHLIVKWCNFSISEHVTHLVPNIRHKANCLYYFYHLSIYRTRRQVEYSFRVNVSITSINGTIIQAIKPSSGQSTYRGFSRDVIAAKSAKSR